MAESLEQEVDNDDQNEIPLYNYCLKRLNCVMPHGVHFQCYLELILYLSLYTIIQHKVSLKQI